MKTYEVTIMTQENYAHMMNGGYGYSSKIELIDAENAQEAVKIAEKEYPDMVALDSFYRMEIEAEQNEKDASRHGMTVREYKEYKKNEEIWERKHSYLEEILPHISESSVWLNSVIEEIPWMKEHDPELFKKLSEYIQIAENDFNFETNKTKKKKKLLKKFKKLISNEN